MSKCDVCGAALPPDSLVEISGKSVCAECKPNFMMNLKSGVAAGGALPPEQAAAIQARIKRLNLLSFAFAIPGLILQFMGMSGAGRSDPDLAGALKGLGAILVVVGLCFYARMKGRGWAWGLMGIFSLIGLIVLAFLGKRCAHCAHQEPSRSKVCGACGAPV